MMLIQQEIDKRVSWAEEFAAETQPDDQERHLMALLALPANKVWSDADLHNENRLHVALRLLYNRVHGIKYLHLAKSIHPSR